MSKSKQKINILWFKRDLRLSDHQPLQNALLSRNENSSMPLLMIYCFEPSLIKNPNYSERHWQFVQQSLDDMNLRLTLFARRNSFDESDYKIWIFNREVEDVLESIQLEFEIHQIFSHQETGLKLTYTRDKNIQKFCSKNGILWKEYQSNGIIRGLKNRKNWTLLWYETMKEPEFDVNLSIWKPVNITKSWYESHKGELISCPHISSNSLPIQTGGESKGRQYLHSFLKNRIEDYDRNISKPLESRKGCSRLSPYLAWGCLSIKQVYSYYLKNKHDVSSKLFLERLRAQSYFIQVFESNDKMEFENINPNFDSLVRNNNPEHFEAWVQGNTGYPLVDACMRCLNQTGYLNFRMRALLISFLSHHLFQDWKEAALHLARQFTDFEPGIHYSQIQLQVGMFGSEKQPVRIYNPIKQSIDNDPEGVFIKQWITELKNCPTAYIHTPWKIPILEQEMIQLIIGRDYPHPIIDISATYTYAKKQLYPIRSHYLKFPK